MLNKIHEKKDLKNEFSLKIWFSNKKKNDLPHTIFTKIFFSRPTQSI